MHVKEEDLFSKFFQALQEKSIIYVDNEVEMVLCYICMFPQLKKSGLAFKL